jgi:U2-associated protein SR140
VLTESLTLKETPIPSKVARLMLVSDVLHNSSAPVKNASAYRTLFETRLPDIIESFNDLYRNITGRITAEALKVKTGEVESKDFIGGASQMMHYIGFSPYASLNMPLQTIS